MKKYKFFESFSYLGRYYEQGQEYELTPEIVAALPPGIAEEVPTKTTKTKEG
jgi:hypothetical protein